MDKFKLRRFPNSKKISGNEEIQMDRSGKNKSKRRHIVFDIPNEAKQKKPFEVFPKQRSLTASNESRTVEGNRVFLGARRATVPEPRKPEHVQRQKSDTVKTIVRQNMRQAIVKALGCPVKTEIPQISAENLTIDSLAEYDARAAAACLAATAAGDDIDVSYIPPPYYSPSVENLSDSDDSIIRPNRAFEEQEDGDNAPFLGLDDVAFPLCRNDCECPLCSDDTEDEDMPPEIQDISTGESEDNEQDSLLPPYRSPHLSDASPDRSSSSDEQERLEKQQRELKIRMREIQIKKLSAINEAEAKILATRKRSRYRNNYSYGSGRSPSVSKSRFGSIGSNEGSARKHFKPVVRLISSSPEAVAEKSALEEGCADLLIRV